MELVKTYAPYVIIFLLGALLFKKCGDNDSLQKERDEIKRGKERFEGKFKASQERSRERLIEVDSYKKISEARGVKMDSLVEVIEKDDEKFQQERTTVSEYIEQTDSALIRPLYIQYGLDGLWSSRKDLEGLPIHKPVMANVRADLDELSFLKVRIEKMKELWNLAKEDKEDNFKTIKLLEEEIEEVEGRVENMRQQKLLTEEEVDLLDSKLGKLKKQIFWYKAGVIVIGVLAILAVL